MKWPWPSDKNIKLRSDRNFILSGRSPPSLCKFVGEFETSFLSMEHCNIYSKIIIVIQNLMKNNLLRRLNLDNVKLQNNSFIIEH